MSLLSVKNEICRKAKQNHYGSKGDNFLYCRGHFESGIRSSMKNNECMVKLNMKTLTLDYVSLIIHVSSLKEKHGKIMLLIHRHQSARNIKLLTFQNACMQIIDTEFLNLNHIHFAHLQQNSTEFLKLFLSFLLSFFNSCIPELHFQFIFQCWIHEVIDRIIYKVVFCVYIRLTCMWLTHFYLKKQNFWIISTQARQ